MAESDFLIRVDNMVSARILEIFRIKKWLRVIF